jgi:hypothetical protein
MRSKFMALAAWLGAFLVQSVPASALVFDFSYSDGGSTFLSRCRI